jgi:hypothetical protein
MRHEYLAGAPVEWREGVVDEALVLVESIGERFCEAELYRLKGEMLWRHGTLSPWPGAEACFQQGLTLARRQRAKSWELPGCHKPGTPMAYQGKYQAAHDLLAPI